MERVGVLINRLKEQLEQQSGVHHMLVTVQLLHSELLQEAAKPNGHTTSHVSVMVPNVVHFKQPVEVDLQAYKPVPRPDPEPMPQPEPEQLPEPEPHPGPRPEPEPIPIPSFIEAKPWEDIFPKKQQETTWPADPVMEVPTLAHQDKVVYELNDSMSEKEGSLNEKLKEEKAEMASMLQEVPIRDLKKAISINERHRFIHELFRGDETMYERSIKTINGFNIYAEAEYWIQRELKLKVGWDTSLESVKMFDHLVKRRFS